MKRIKQEDWIFCLMKTECFFIKRQYDISCKLFTPDDEKIRNIIIGVHGFAGDKESSMLKKLAAAACSRGAALICFDFPAHGSSPVGEDMLTAQNCKEDLLAVVQYVSTRYPEAEKSIFATSFGGYITLLCAQQLPDVKLVLRSPAVTMPKVLLENVLKISAEDFKAQKFVQCGYERPLRLPYTFYEGLLSQKLPGENQLTAPTLIVHGDKDDIVPLSDVTAFADNRETVALYIMPGADHRFKKPGQINTIVHWTTAFLRI